MGILWHMISHNLQDIYLFIPFMYFLCFPSRPDVAEMTWTVLLIMSWCACGIVFAAAHTLRLITAWTNIATAQPQYLSGGRLTTHLQAFCASRSLKIQLFVRLISHNSAVGVNNTFYFLNNTSFNQTRPQHLLIPLGCVQSRLAAWGLSLPIWTNCKQTVLLDKTMMLQPSMDAVDDKHLRDPSSQICGTSEKTI